VGAGREPVGGPPGEGADGGLSRVLDRNIGALIARRREEEGRRRASDRVAERISRFAGSMTFVWVHVVAYAAWAAPNLGLVPGVPKFDPTFATLAAVASLEAIFLSTFILVTQNRMASAADRRADLDLQISLLAEHEVTRLIRLTAAIAARMGIPEARADDIADLEKDVRPEAVLDRLERQGELAERGEVPRPPGDDSITP
jgi:uncharacterized membrane protein